MVRTVDTDVVIIAISHFLNLGWQEIWIAFGIGQKFRYIPIHQIVANLGPEKSKGMSYFHAFTGCDTVSFFAQTWKEVCMADLGSISRWYGGISEVVSRTQ